MTDHTVDPVIRMAGEIIAQFEHRSRDETARAVAEHIRLFWDPRMRRKLQAAVASRQDLDPDIRRAAALLAEPR